jgi:hypothetical protein
VQADVIPLAVFERYDPRCLVVGGVIIVDVGKPAECPAPSAENERAEILADGKGQPAEKVAAVDPHRFESDFIVRFERHCAAPGYAGHVVADIEVNAAVLDVDLTLPAEIGDLPAPQCFAIEKTYLVGHRFNRAIRLIRPRLSDLGNFDSRRLLDNVRRLAHVRYIRA